MTDRFFYLTGLLPIQALMVYHSRVSNGVTHRQSKHVDGFEWMNILCTSFRWYLWSHWDDLNMLHDSCSPSLPEHALVCVSSPGSPATPNWVSSPRGPPPVPLHRTRCSGGSVGPRGRIVTRRNAADPSRQSRTEGRHGAGETLRLARTCSHETEGADFVNVRWKG